MSPPVPDPVPAPAVAPRPVASRRERAEDLLNFLRAATRGLVVLHRSRLEPGAR